MSGFEVKSRIETGMCIPSRNEVTKMSTGQQGTQVLPPAGKARQVKIKAPSKWARVKAWWQDNGPEPIEMIIIAFVALVFAMSAFGAIGVIRYDNTGVNSQQLMTALDNNNVAQGFTVDRTHHAITGVNPDGMLGKNATHEARMAACQASINLSLTLGSKIPRAELQAVCDSIP